MHAKHSCQSGIIIDNECCPKFGCYRAVSGSIRNLSTPQGGTARFFITALKVQCISRYKQNELFDNKIMKCGYSINNFEHLIVNKNS